MNSPVPKMLGRERGFTLTEVLLAMALVGVVVFGVVIIDLTSFRMGQQVSRDALLSTGQQQAALALSHLTRTLAPADRVVLLTNSSLLLRRPQMTTAACTGGVPDPTCFDLDDNYQWDQYLLAGETLRFYTDIEQGCGTIQSVATQLTGVAFDYVNASPPPPGGDPDVEAFSAAPDDTNMVSYTLQWSHQGQSQSFHGTVAIRAAPYSDVNAGASGTGDSGTGLAPATTAVPPACAIT